MSHAAAISTLDRGATLDRLERERFDVVVIGGGITGAGIAREGSLRGLRIALLEARDFAAGTSSRSSKLIHGGLRYLAMGDVGLVREAALERKEIFRLAPHLAERRWMVVPARSRTALAKLRVGITAYEKLGAVQGEDVHRNWSGDELEREEPALAHDRYPYACAYREYLTDDARLVLANLRSAVGDGAAVLNHARVDAVIVESGRADGVEAVCRESGRRVAVRGDVVVNAAGPWVEAVRKLEQESVAPMLHLSKGVHVVLPADRLPVRNMVVLGAADRRSIFAIRRGSVVYLGTTDTTYGAGPDEWPEITREDVQYLLEPIPRYFGVEAVKLEEITAAWSGLRPLVAQAGKAPTEISRRDEVVTGAAGLLTIAGGKLTGYRPMAHRVLEDCAAATGRPLPPEAVDDPPLPGGDFDGDLGRLEATLGDVPPPIAARLVRLYGTEAPDVLAGGARALAGSEVVEGEVDWAVQREGACALEDVLYRRTRAAFYEPQAREAAVEPIAARMAELLGWDAARSEREVDRTRALLANDLAFLTPSG